MLPDTFEFHQWDCINLLLTLVKTPYFPYIVILVSVFSTTMNPFTGIWWFQCILSPDILVSNCIPACLLTRRDLLHLRVTNGCHLHPLSAVALLTFSPHPCQFGIDKSSFVFALLECSACRYSGTVAMADYTPSRA